jgi:hypothetical protein
VTTVAFWIFLADNYVMIGLLSGMQWVFAFGIVVFLVPGDMLSAWLAIRIMRR